MLARMAALGPAPARYTCFHSLAEPSLSISAYLDSLESCFGCSDECFVIALVYIDRLVKRDPAFTVCKLNCHRLVVTALMLAVKFNDDNHYTNAWYAGAGGLSCDELSKLELVMLNELEWQLNVPQETYRFYFGMVRVGEDG